MNILDTSFFAERAMSRATNISDSELREKVMRLVTQLRYLLTAKRDLDDEILGIGFASMPDDERLLAFSRTTIAGHHIDILTRNIQAIFNNQKV